jgi:colanic acid biosynthesis glycosyl transferase WcaI
MTESPPRRPRVLVLTQVYHPEPNFITADVAEALAEHCDVTVVTAHPNYPHGRFYPGVRYLRIDKSVSNGVTVWRVPFIPDHSLSPVRRAISYLSFAIIASIVSPLVAGRPDTVWVYHGPFTTGLAALFFKLAYRSKLVFTCADLWPDSFMAAGVVKSRLLMDLAGAYNRFLHRAADSIVCATRGTKRRFAEEGIPRDRLSIIPVWIGGTGELAAKAPLADSGSRRIVYTGNLGPAQNLGTVIRAASAIKQEDSSIRFDMYGSGASEEELKSLALQVGATNVVFHGRVPVESAFEASATAMAQIICLQSSPLFAKTVPSKIFSAFAAGSPILYGLKGEAAALAAESGGGIDFDADSPESLVAAVKKLRSLSINERNSMRSRLRQFFSENFDPAILVARYINTLAPAKDLIPANVRRLELPLN